LHASCELRIRRLNTAHDWHDGERIKLTPGGDFGYQSTDRSK
jgi:hypothetical protein